MIIREIQRAAGNSVPIIGVNRFDTEMITPDQIIAAIEEVRI
jgi:hypothetical protein